MTTDEIDAEGEAALAMVQSTIQNAIDKSGKTHAEIETTLCVPRGYLCKNMRGDARVTVYEVGRILAACGFELRRFPALPTLGVNVPETRIFHWPGCENGEKR